MQTTTPHRPLRSSSIAALGLALFALAGCDPQDVDDLGEVALRPGGWGCSHCGVVLGNSPNINGAALSDINLVLANSNGIKVKLGTTPQNRPFRLDVDPTAESFRAIDPQDPDQVLLQGTDFIGAKIALEMPGAIDVTLVITDMDEEVESWSPDGAPLVAYRAEYMSGGQYVSLCPSTSQENQWFTLIAGEVYEQSNNGTMRGISGITSAPTSVTLACVGEAAAKMKLMDFHPAGNREASQAERMATLRMITADYCGDGTPYTGTGIPVAWRDDKSIIEPPTTEDILEAMWTPSGARCLDTPRLVERDMVHCEIPSCDDNFEFDGGDVWRTMLPSE